MKIVHYSQNTKMKERNSHMNMMEIFEQHHGENFELEKFLTET